MKDTRLNLNDKITFGIISHHKHLKFDELLNEALSMGINKVEFHKSINSLNKAGYLRIKKSRTDENKVDSNEMEYLLMGVRIH